MAEQEKALSQSSIQALIDVMARLRDPETGCPWDKVQTFATIAPYTIEEAYEVADAIRLGDMKGLREELGDLLLQVVYHARMAEEAGLFAFDDVARDITAKMYRRNTHVFGGDEHPAAGLTDPAAINEAWEAAKADEKQRSSVTEGLPPGLPALLYADKVLDRLDRAGRPVVVEPAETLGDRLLALVVEARAEGVAPGQALREPGRRVLPD